MDDLDEAGTSSTALVAEPKPRRQTEVDGAAQYIEQMKCVSEELSNVVLADGVAIGVAMAFISHVGRYEALMIGFVAENERLRGRLVVYEVDGVGRGARGAPVIPPPVTRSVSTTAASVVPAVVVPKPLVTWSVVVKGKGGSTSKEVVEHLRLLRPRITMQRVDSEIPPEDFMEDLFKWILSDVMSAEAYKKRVRLVSSSWRPNPGEVNVLLECTPQVVEHLETTSGSGSWCGRLNSYGCATGY